VTCTCACTCTCTCSHAHELCMHIVCTRTLVVVRPREYETGPLCTLQEMNPFTLSLDPSSRAKGTARPSPAASPLPILFPVVVATSGEGRRVANTTPLTSFGGADCCRLTMELRPVSLDAPLTIPPSSRSSMTLAMLDNEGGGAAVRGEVPAGSPNTFNARQLGWSVITVLLLSGSSFVMITAWCSPHPAHHPSLVVITRRG
jgi:hypothetical protein